MAWELSVILEEWKGENNQNVLDTLWNYHWNVIINSIPSSNVCRTEGTPACFIAPFAWKTFFQPSFTLRQCLSLILRCASCMQQNTGSCLLLSLLLAYAFLLGNLMHWCWEILMTNNVFKFLLFLLLEMVLYMCECVCFSSFGFVVRCWIPCVFATLLVLKFSIPVSSAGLD